MSQLRKYLNKELDERDFDRFTQLLVEKKFDREKKEEWARLLKDNHNIQRQNGGSSPTIRRSLRWSLAAAATVALLIASVVFWPRTSSPNYQQLAEQYVRELPVMADQLVFRKGQFQEDASRIKANEAYIEQDFVTAIQQWELLISHQKANNYDRFYLGVSYLRTTPSQPEKALALLQEAQSTTPELRQEINWIMALAYIRTDQLTKAQSLLQTIVQNDEYMSAKAAQLLQELPATQ
jgi:hypothetical protein